VAAVGEGKRFFFEKKNQKTFAPVAEVFASFFKKKRFLSSLPIARIW
jgi:hypothetical protein